MLGWNQLAGPLSRCFGAGWMRPPPLSGFPRGDINLDSEGFTFLGTGGHNSLAEGGVENVTKDILYFVCTAI